MVWQRVWRRQPLSALNAHPPLWCPQDGQAITPSERIAARQALPQLEQQLLQELQDEGVDVAAAASVEDDGDALQDEEVAETGYVDEQGELRRPWCPQTRILEHREMVGGAHKVVARTRALLLAAAPAGAAHTTLAEHATAHEGMLPALVAAGEGQPGGSSSQGERTKGPPGRAVAAAALGGEVPLHACTVNQGGMSVNPLPLCCCILCCRTELPASACGRPGAAAQRGALGLHAGRVRGRVRGLAYLAHQTGAHALQAVLWDMAGAAAAGA